MPTGQETRVTDPNTGAQKGMKLERFDLIPVEPLTALAQHYGRGAQKYEERNWEKGYRWSLSYQALCRHLFAWWNGEDNDPETGSSHLTAVAWHAFGLFWFQLRGAGTDDRPRQVTNVTPTPAALTHLSLKAVCPLCSGLLDAMGVCVARCALSTSSCGCGHCRLCRT